MKRRAEDVKQAVSDICSMKSFFFRLNNRQIFVMSFDFFQYLASYVLMSFS